jgi:hypothetical protein
MVEIWRAEKEASSRRSPKHQEARQANGGHREQRKGSGISIHRDKFRRCFEGKMAT